MQCIQDDPTPYTVYFGKKPINLSEISRRSGIDCGLLSRIFSGKRQPTLRTARKIAKTLEITVDHFLSQLDQKKV